MPTFRTAQRTVLTAAVLSTSVLAGPSLAHAAPVPPACMEALTTTFDKFPVLHYTVPTEVKNALLSGAAGLSEADQQEFTEAACKAVNGWATTHGPAVAKDLDARYLNAAGPMCNKFTVASVAVAKKYVPNLPAATWRLEPVAKKVWQNAMQKLSVESPDPTCRQAYTNAKAGW